MPTDAELRIAQAQLVGWLEGLFHGIQTALFAQQMAARAQLEQMRRALPPGAWASSPRRARPGPASTCDRPAPTLCPPAATRGARCPGEARQPCDAAAAPTPVVRGVRARRRSGVARSDDLRGGLAPAPLWGYLGWQDIKQRYRRSVLGPFWITIATGVQATAMGILYSALLDDLAPRRSCPTSPSGLIVWNLISASILEGSEVFIANEGLIQHLPSPLSVHVYRLVWRQILFFAHNLVIWRS